MSEENVKTNDFVASAKSLVEGSVRLASLPEVCIRVNEMLDEDNVTVAGLGRVILQDTSLTARLLKIVNSSYYGFESKIETVSRAVTVVGLRELRGLVIAASAVEMFSNVPDETLNKVRFWRHSLYCGVIARLLADKCHVLHSERLFVAGLLHDIGKLIIAQRLPDKTLQIILTARENKQPIFEIERKLLGFTHAEVGGELMKLWNMPETLFEAVAFHHSPRSADKGLMETCLVHIANILTHDAEQKLDKGRDVNLQVIDPLAWEVTGLDDSIQEYIFSEAGPLFVDALETILPRSHPAY